MGWSERCSPSAHESQSRGSAAPPAGGVARRRRRDGQAGSVRVLVRAVPPGRAGTCPANGRHACPVSSHQFFPLSPFPWPAGRRPPHPPLPGPIGATAHLLAPGGGGGLGPWKFFEGRCPVRRKTSNGGPALLFPSHRYCYCYYYLYRVTPDSGIVRSVLRWGLRPCECACKHACWYGRCWKERDIIVTCYTLGIMDRL